MAVAALNFAERMAPAALIAAFHWEKSACLAASSPYR